ncbi:hypothetical protein ADP64_000036 [Achromobacter phage phiAxp-2]|uniref:Uncharacterized protein n=1 Tax=Achromobacter phage phiAxp-2 TaxID=1664246 RepID=A0A0K2FH83_9CAUD|nr:hypothetical protein ADP64_000036 [Achromobacter phage phiAxp-2]ALA45434.1 hypothetical protein ADP64_000036 [Achromobacter phage phiAxp-2]
MNTDIIARLFCAALTFYVPFMAFAIPWSLPARILSVEGIVTIPLYVLMTLIAALIVLDVVANKMCPFKVCQLQWLVNLRESVFIGAAFCALVTPFSASKVLGADDATGYLYLVIFTGSLALSWCDAFDKRGVNRATFL